MNSSDDIRAAFVDFFARNGHEAVPSGPLVPHNDPTLLFTNAGMVQFKNIFTGVETRPYSRAVTAQKCVRAGGKHNDLDNVGYTARHHTFFEMLGNFSFGDYFKDAAIEFAWRLITQEFKIAADRLTVTVYADDEEAFDNWRKISGLPESRILRIATADNFWSMGDIGPCGPCTEIFYDHGPELKGGPPGSPDQNGDRFVEIWNLVFMQYEQTEDGKRVPLPRQSVDTGMGLERLAAVLQGVHDSYDTDILRALILASAELTGKAPDGPQAVSHRVIADHLRASCFLIADGVLPSNEGRGYVLRRIMRRAMRHIHMLGMRDPAMWRLVPILVSQMGQAYPELVRAQALVTDTLRHEETRFRQTLDRGLKLLEEETAALGKHAALPGEVAFKLYDTFGFPLDLTEDVLRAQGRKVDTDGFNQAMERQRVEARKSWTGSGEAATDRIWFEIRERTGPTEFLGYAHESAEGEIVAIIAADGNELRELEAGREAAIVTNQTPFYGESGGQQGDTGILFTEHGAEFTVSDTRRHAGDVFVHLGRMIKGKVKLGEIVELRVDGTRRTKLRANHSATHLLHEALRRTLGDHVTQKGSLVADDRLRFDFSHPKTLTPEEIETIESEVNARVRMNSDVMTRFMTPKEAVDQGALALFGEKYGDEVRVVSMGGGEAERFSIELCGGTHVRRTGDIGLFKIVGESAVGSGVRRIEALTGEAAIDYMDEQERRLNEAASALRVSPADVPARVLALVEERRKLERELSEARRKLASGGGASEAPAFKDIGGIKFAGRLLGDVPAKELKPMADDLKKQIGSGVVALASSAEGKASLVVGITPDLTSRFDAVQLVRVGSEALGGKGGGGRPDMAQAGGPNVDALGDALSAIEQAIGSGNAGGATRPAAAARS
ncbi:MAG: alanine--tRNA ligase [Alphaproteobacteria bacterium]